MLDFADVIAVNKADKRGSEMLYDTLLNKFNAIEALDQSPDAMPVFGCMASRFGDSGVDRLFEHLMTRLSEVSTLNWQPGPIPVRAPSITTIVPPHRERYLSDVAQCVREHHKTAQAQAELASKADGLWRTLKTLTGKDYAVLESIAATPAEADVASVIGAYNQAVSQLDETSRTLVQSMPELRDAFSQPTYTYTVRDRAICVENIIELCPAMRSPKSRCLKQKTGARF